MFSETLYKMQYQAPPPPYVSAASSVRSFPAERGSISALPLHLLHRILTLTLDPMATPSRFAADPTEERVRRLWALFRGLRGVDRRFYQVSTSILRNCFFHTYVSLLPRGTSSDPFPASADSSTSEARAIEESVFLKRSRETAIFDRFIANRVGEDLRRIESTLFEESEAQQEIMKRLQPKARVEDLLLTIPSNLISRGSSYRPQIRLPLPFPHLYINLTPSWAQLFFSSVPVESPTKSGASKQLIIEVRRQDTPERTVRRIRQGLDDLSKGLVGWGGKVA